MIINGSIYLTSDPNMIINNINSSKVINVTESPIYVEHPNSVKASILLPPIDALMADQDNNIELLRNIYYRYFVSDEVTEFMAIICAVLNKGVNIFMYVPGEELREFSYVGILLEMISNTYGIYIGTSQRQFAFDSRFNQYIADLLFNNNLLDINIYMKEADFNIAANESIIKLDMILNPPVLYKTIDTLRSYFINGNGRKECIHIVKGDEMDDIIRNYGSSSIY